MQANIRNDFLHIPEPLDITSPDSGSPSCLLIVIGRMGINIVTGKSFLPVNAFKIGEEFLSFFTQVRVSRLSSPGDAWNQGNHPAKNKLPQHDETSRQASHHVIGVKEISDEVILTIDRVGVNETQPILPGERVERHPQNGSCVHRLVRNSSSNCHTASARQWRHEPQQSRQLSPRTPEQDKHDSHREPSLALIKQMPRARDKLADPQWACLGNSVWCD